MSEKKRITSFRDLEVYQNSYKAMLDIMKVVLPKLPDCEKHDLKDQLSRACKSIPRLIAEGYAKRHPKAGFRKYLDDAMGECNEMVVSLSQCEYICNINREICDKLIDIYDKSGRQLYKLGSACTNFKTRQPSPKTETGIVTVTEKRTNKIVT